MKTTTRRFLIPTTLMLALGASGVSLAQAPGAKSPQPPRGMQMQQQKQMMNRGRLGIVVLPISEELRARLGAPRDRGVLVDAVRPDSPAAKAGLRVGDVITSVDGDAVTAAADFANAMMDRKKGQGVALAIVRDGRPLQVTATLDTDPGPRGPMGGMGPMGPMGRMGPMSGMGGDDTFEMPGPGGGTWRWLEPPGGDGDSSADTTGSADVQRQLDETRKRLDELEQRLDRLEQR